MNYKTEERRAWVQFMVAELRHEGDVAFAAANADRALEEYRKRFPPPPPLSSDGGEWQ